MPIPHSKIIGALGLGQMGLPMAANLVRRGFRTLGYDPKSEALAGAVAAGVEPAPSPAAVFAAADVVVLSMPTQEILEQAIFGPGGFLAGSTTGKTLIDTTTTTVAVAQRIAVAVDARGARYLDAPVTGGVNGATKGTLSIMVGGDEEAFRAQQEVFSALGSNIVHIGPSGHGQVSKMVNQMLMAAIYTSVAEAFAFAAQFGADVRSIYAAVEQGGGRSGLLNNIKTNLLAGTTRETHNLAQHGKDIDYVMMEAATRKLYLPITSSAHEFYNLARSMGFGPISSGEMWAVWEKLMDIKITDTIRPETQPPFTP